LLLATRELAASSADVGVDAVGILADKLPSISEFKSIHDLIIRSVWLAEKHVFLDGAIEKAWFLTNIADLLPVVSQLQLVQWLAIHKYSSRIGLVEALDKLHDCALSRARRSDERCVGTLLKLDIEVLQHNLVVPFWIAKVNIFKFDFAF